MKYTTYKTLTENILKYTIFEKPKRKVNESLFVFSLITINDQFTI